MLQAFAPAECQNYITNSGYEFVEVKKALNREVASRPEPTA